MEGYKTLTEAVAMALKVCSTWYGDETEETYGTEDMSYIAQIIDYESPNTSDELFYVVFPDGEIGLLCTYDRSIRRLFIPSDSDFVPTADMLLNEDNEMIADDTMPHRNIFEEDKLESQSVAVSVPNVATVEPERNFYFCIYCGTKLCSRFKFCPKCGKRIEV